MLFGIAVGLGGADVRSASGGSSVRAMAPSLPIGHARLVKIDTDLPRGKPPSLGGTGAKARTGRLWVYVRDDRPSGDAAPPAV
jgi:hypothetical protein